MRAKLFVAKALLALSVMIVLAAPTTASAHDNLGGDELAAANWMLIGAMVVAVMGALALLWGWRAGQFDNVEEIKYRMLEMADDYEKIVAEAEREESVGTPQRPDHADGPARI